MITLFYHDVFVGAGVEDGVGGGRGEAAVGEGGVGDIVDGQSGALGGGDRYVVKAYVGRLGEESALTGGHGGVGERDVLDGHFGEAVKLDGDTRSSRFDAVDEDVAESRGAFVDSGHVGGGAAVGCVVEVEEQGFMAYFEHVYVVDVDILHESATTAVALETKAYVGADELAIGHLDVAHSARHFTADHEAAVALEDTAAVDEDVLGRDGAGASYLIFARLDAHGIVTYIKGGTGDDDVAARLDVHGVGVLRVDGVLDIDTVDDDVFAHDGVERPGGRVLEEHALEEQIATLDEFDHVGTEEVLDGEGVLVGHIALIAETFALIHATLVLLGGVPGVVVDETALSEEVTPLVAVGFATAHVAPGIAVAIDDTRAGDGDVVEVLTVDGRGTAVALETLVGDAVEGIERPWSVGLLLPLSDTSLIVSLNLSIWFCDIKSFTSRDRKSFKASSSNMPVFIPHAVASKTLKT